MFQTINYIRALYKYFALFLYRLDSDAEELPMETELIDELDDLLYNQADLIISGKLESEIVS